MAGHASSLLSVSLARRGVHYGWAVAGATFLTMLVTAGTIGAAGILILPLQREFGWDTATIGSALAVRLVRSRGRRLHRYRGYRL